MKVPEILIQKYNTAAPRYTSYPPANFFKNNEWDNKQILNIIQQSNERNPQHIAIYIHIPFCNKICYYCGCYATKLSKNTDTRSYIKMLKKEISMVAAQLDKSRKVSQIHYGGGTPNALEASVIKELNEFILSKFTTIDNPEIAIECNPAYLDYSYIDALLQAGFNRFSLGIQDFNTSILKTVNRDASQLPLQDVLDYIKQANPQHGVNFDFIYGLPGQTSDSFAYSIEKAIDIKPDRLVTFSYAHVPWVKKHQLILEQKGLPSSQEKMQMFLTAYELLKAGGYMPIGFDHYVLPHDELYKALQNNELHRNFQGYCTRRTTGQVYAFGVSAITQLEQAYLQNTKDMDAYITSLHKGLLPVDKYYTLNNKELIIRDVITQLMCNQYIDFDMQAQKFGITRDELFSVVRVNEQEIRNFENDNLLFFNDNKIKITELGNVFMRNIAASLDPLYHIENQTYSKTV